MILKRLESFDKEKMGLLRKIAFDIEKSEIYKQNAEILLENHEV